MNAVVQLTRQVQYLLIALLFASFAVVQSANAVGPEPNEDEVVGNMAEEDDAVPDLGSDTENAAVGEAATDPNERTIKSRGIIEGNALQCGFKEKIWFNVELRVSFKSNGNGKVLPVKASIETFDGDGQRTGRTYMGNKVNIEDIKTIKKKGGGEGTVKFRIPVTSKPKNQGGLQTGANVDFVLVYGKFWTWEKGNVKSFTTESTPVVCCPASPCR
jgi:hypothetical protein